MTMSWVPPDLSEACQVHTTVTTCSHSTFVFLQLIATLFGNSPDASSGGHDAGHGNVYRDFIFGGAPHDFFDGAQEFFGGAHAGFGDSHGGFGDSHGGFGDGHENSGGSGGGGDAGGGKEQHDEEFDFIVVGAGSAGCVVANRLSEVHQWKVLLLEAGGEEPKVADVPAFAPMLQRSSIDWAYMTQPSPHSCLARPEGQCHWARGKVMGGSSTINYMIYIRGSPEDYDEWAAMGNHGWKYQDVLPYFIKSEDNQNPELVKLLYHGQGGYQSVSIFPYQDKNVFHIIDAFRELGLPELDQNSEHQIGVSLLQTTSRHGQRESTNVAYIRPVRNKRKNLVIRTNAHASRILIDPHSKTAYGVEYYVKGSLYRAVAKKEVIVSAGAIESPKLLMLSGIGHSSHLFSHRIEVIHELPVGFNLHDHTTIDGVVFALTNKTATIVDDEKRNADVHYYKETHKGPLSATGSLQVNAMVQTKYEKSKKRPDIQYSFDSANVKDLLTDPILTAQTNVNPLAYYDGLMIRPVLLHPVSRGYILLNDSDPVFGQPLIYANTFSEKIDLLRMVEGIKQALNLLDTKSMEKIHAQLVTTPLPACYHYEFGTDDYWACVAMSYTATIFHPVGTCKMGPKNDKSAVVDNKLRVHGIKNLRVVDASIMPKIPRGNTNAPTIMIAEKGSDFIKKKWLERGGLRLEDKLPYEVHEEEQHFYDWSL